MKHWKNTKVHQWKQAGNVYLWRYTKSTKNFPGWHMTADEEGCLSLLDLFERMEEDECSSERTICITPPKLHILMAPGNQEGYAKWKAPERLKIRYRKDSPSKAAWHIEEIVESKVLLSLGKTYIDKLRKGIQAIMKGEGDYSIGTWEHSLNSVKMRLWFWWMLK